MSEKVNTYVYEIWMLNRLYGIWIYIFALAIEIQINIERKHLYIYLYNERKKNIKINKKKKIVNRLLFGYKDKLKTTEWEVKEMKWDRNIEITIELQQYYDIYIIYYYYALYN